MLRYSIVESPVGRLAIVMSRAALLRLEFHRGISPGGDCIYDEAATEAVRGELSEYFAGKRREFSVPLDLRGSEFQRRCWRELLRIPYGETRSYGDIARAIGSPRAFRAVGMANHDNPIAIIVPCHRVIASGGSLCGYGGGLDIKRKLLQLEGALTAGLDDGATAG
ncbi:MAG: methylated-DNA--[protein]-cysteine S-methyltransferase [Acidobacteria bacterium]|nr:methylated-DNA--[protein]-cysteine S-methyltransferase [Acidobacteriota bacterium]